MEIFILISLFFLGTLFGSFSSVLIFRWKNNQSGIVGGRSECPKCHNTLGAKELIPLFSYLFQRGKCYHCNAKISIIYPILEMTFGIFFLWAGYIGLYVLRIDVFSISFIFLLFFIFITALYISYDILFLEIPIQSFFLFVFIFFILIILGYYVDFKSIFILTEGQTFQTFIQDRIIGAIVLYSFFYFQILLSGGIFFIKHKKYKDATKLILWYFTFPFVALYQYLHELFHNKKIVEIDDEEEIPLWIGPGDLFVAIIIGLTLGTKLGIIAIFIAYILGSALAIPLLIIHRQSAQRIPFGPFLGLGSIIALTFNSQITKFIELYFSYFFL